MSVPATMLLGAAVGVFGASLAGRSLAAVAVSGALLAVLAAVSVIDLRERRIPNAFTYSGTAGALLVAAVVSHEAFLLAALGAALGTLGMGALWALGRGRLGVGDVKLCTLVGSVLGPGGVPAFLLLGTVIGAVAAAAMLVRGRGRKATLAYGPYLAAGAAITLLLRGPVAG